MRPPVTVVVTAGGASMDRYGARLAERLDGAEVLELDVDGTSTGVMGIPALSTRSLSALAGDARCVRALRATSGVPHLTNHHLARYGPLLGRPYLVTVHDLIRWHDAHDGTAYISRPTLRDRIWTRRDCRGIAGAQGVIAPSEATRRELVGLLGVGVAAVRVVPHGIDHALFRPVPGRPVAGRYVLFVGSEQPRKGLVTLLTAFAALKRLPAHSDVRLVKVGLAGTREAPYRERTRATVDALALGADVVFTEGVADEELPAYYSAATCFVLPSLAEGFGLPPLEAMACGCPTIVSAAGALPEVAADAALVVQAGDADSLRAALERVLDDAGLRADLRERGLARAAHYSWDRTAAETVQAYEELLGERGQRRPAHV